MKSNFYYIIGLCFLITSCNSKPDPYLVSNQSVGALTDSTTVSELKKIFINDSITKFIAGDEFISGSNIISIFDKETKSILLELTPKEALDSLSTIQNVRIMDKRYKTKKGLDKICDFGCISKNYNISSIQNTLRNLIISVDEINAYFTIDKKELPETLRYDMITKIEAVSIPQKAKIKDFFIQWY